MIQGIVWKFLVLEGEEGPRFYCRWGVSPGIRRLHYAGKCYAVTDEVRGEWIVCREETA